MEEFQWDISEYLWFHFLHLLFYTLQGIEQNKLEDRVLFDVNAISNIYLCIYSNTHIHIGYMSM